MAIWNAIKSIGSAIGGDLVSGIFGSSAQSKANKTNIKLQQQQLDWQERMANTEWQRGVNDLKAAGLNPMLAYSQGGASSPNVSAATVEPVDAMSRSISSAASKAMQSLQLAQQEENIKLTQAQTLKATNEAAVSAVTAENERTRQNLHLNIMRKEIDNLIERTFLTEEQKRQIHEMLPLLLEEKETGNKLLKYQTPSAKAEAEVWEKLGAAGRGANIGANALQQLIAIIRSMSK